MKTYRRYSCTVRRVVVSTYYADVDPDLEGAALEQALLEGAPDFEDEMDSMDLVAYVPASVIIADDNGGHVHFNPVNGAITVNVYGALGWRGAIITPQVLRILNDMMAAEVL